MKPERIKEVEDLIERLTSEGENALRKNLSMGMHGLCTEAASALRELLEERQRARELIAQLSNGDVIAIADALARLSGTDPDDLMSINEGPLKKGRDYFMDEAKFWLPLPSPPEEGERK